MSLNADTAASLVARVPLAPASYANTAGATSGAGFWIDTLDLEGDLVVTQSVNGITGSLAGKLQTATDVNGTGAADLSGATFTSVTTSNNVQTLVIPKTSLPNRYLGYVGTIVTGPAVVSITVHGSKKYS